MAAIIRDGLAEAQWLRALGYAPYGGADPGECLAIAGRIDGADPTRWYDAWTEVADRLGRAAERSLAAGDAVGARSAWFRAANYFRTAGLFLLRSPVDDRLTAAHRAEVEAFRRGAELLEVPPERIEVPFEQVALPCSFFRPAADGGPRPTLVLVNGYDGTAEELYFTSGAAALARGYNVLTFDGPGQGGVLLDRGVPMRPDWEHVLPPIIDALVARGDVDPSRIVLMGLSFGGYLAPRAATGEHRIAACVSDCGPYDLFAAATARLPRRLVPALDDTAGPRAAILRRLLAVVLRRPAAGWALRRNLLVHGLTDPVEYFRAARAYTLRGLEDRITCPTFVCTTDRDDLSATGAAALHSALTCTKAFTRFRAEDGAGEHCESGARLAFHETVFAWLESVLPPARIS